MSEPDDRLQDDSDDSDVAHRLKSGMLWLRDGRIVVRREQGLVFLGFWDSKEIQESQLSQYPVDEKYDPSQPRDEIGRFSSGSGTASEEFAIGTLSALETIPQSIRDRATKAGVTVAVVKRTTDAMEELKGVTPRGWPPGSTWDEAAGLFNPNDNKVIVAEEKYDRDKKEFIAIPSHAGILRHEYGHAVDENFGKLSETSEFRKAWNDDTDALLLDTESFFRRGSYHLKGDAAQLSYFIQHRTRAGAQEAFAEAFAVLHGGGAAGEWMQQIFKKRFPQTLEATKELIQ